jgi:hypothetical protein
VHPVFHRRRLRTLHRLAVGEPLPKVAAKEI